MLLLQQMRGTGRKGRKKEIIFPKNGPGTEKGDFFEMIEKEKKGPRIDGTETDTKEKMKEKKIMTDIEIVTGNLGIEVQEVHIEIEEDIPVEIEITDIEGTGMKDSD